MARKGFGDSGDGEDEGPLTRDTAWLRAAESSEMIRHRVVAARNSQLRRFFDEHIYSNAQMCPRHIRKYCVLSPECEKIMENAVTKLGFSARGYDRILKRNRTRFVRRQLERDRVVDATGSRFVGTDS